MGKGKRTAPFHMARCRHPQPISNLFAPLRPHARTRTRALTSPWFLRCRRSDASSTCPDISAASNLA